MISWPPEPYVPQSLDVPFARKNIIWLRIMHPPFPLLPPGPPCPGRLFAWLTGLEPSQRVNEVDIVEEVANYILPLVLGVAEVSIQVA
jgi:hypothetical protein